MFGERGNVPDNTPKAKSYAQNVYDMKIYAKDLIRLFTCIVYDRINEPKKVFFFSCNSLFFTYITSHANKKG